MTQANVGYFVPFQMQQELAKAVKAAGGRGLPLGSRLRIVFTHESPSAGGGNPRKEYSVTFTPVADVTLAQTPPAAVQGRQDSRC